MNIEIDRRRRSIGLAVGSFWLVLAGAAFGAWSIFAIDTLSARWVLGGVVVLTSVLLMFGISVIRAAALLPRSTAPRTTEERSLSRRFGVVALGEVIAFATINPIAAMTGHAALIPSLNLAIIGLHFLPLAWLFDVPRYYVMGVLFCGIPMLTLWALPADAMIGSAFGWYVVPSVGCGIVAVLTGAAGLREARQSLTIATP